jgi:uncharacterized protein with HEPN domain
VTRRAAQAWLDDIIFWGERLAGHLDGIDRKEFFANELLQDAVSKCAEVIGEACGKLDDLDPSLNGKFPDLDLKRARKSRDRLSHGYYHMKIDMLWSTVTVSIPQTVVAAKAVLQKVYGGKTDPG